VNELNSVGTCLSVVSLSDFDLISPNSHAACQSLDTVAFILFLNAVSGFCVGKTPVNLKIGKLKTVWDF